jgi:hypothetical protein
VQGGSAMNSVVEEEPVVQQLATDPENKKRIYPNPFSEDFNIDLYNSSATNRVSAEIYDLAGRRLYRRDFNHVSIGNITLRVQPQSSKLNPGVYIVQVKVNGHIVQSSKLVKVKK